MPTLDVTGRCDLGFDTPASDDAAAHAQQTAHDRERADMANPSGHVDVTLGGWAAVSADELPYLPARGIS